MEEQKSNKILLKEKITVAFTLERRHIKYIDELRKLEGLSRSAFLRQIIDFSQDFSEAFDKRFTEKTALGRQVEEIIKNVVKQQMKEGKIKHVQ